MFWRYIIKLLKIGVSIVLLVFVGIMGFCYFSDDYGAFIVLSDSMQPTISSGDIVFTGRPNHPFTDEIKPGTIVTYRHNEELVTHRIVSIKGDALAAKGDAMEDTDPWPISRFYDVEGIYITHVPYVGKLSFFIRTKTGWFITIILPALFLLALVIKEIIKETFRGGQEIYQQRRPYRC